MCGCGNAIVRAYIQWAVLSWRKENSCVMRGVAANRFCVVTFCGADPSQRARASLACMCCAAPQLTRELVLLRLLSFVPLLVLQLYL